MSDDRWQRIKDLFGEACALPTQLRSGFLEEACEDDPSVQAEVISLLEHHGGTELSEGEPEGAGPEAEAAGTVIDRYRLLEQIGEGGMGVVWMAEQLRPVKRMVALKIIKLGMDSGEVVARFEAERQALALMDHPHIAKVLDGGATATGRPFFVMELVKGVPITEWCDEAGLETGARLSLFRQVALAVQHAHTRGVIHRDIKPSNVLVTLHDGEPVPKVIDFGIAKAIDQELTERTCFTRFRQVVGTPECMAPEQAEMSGLDVDARADIYSLGVLLYELLTGTKPFDIEELRARGYLEMLRTIREVDPPKPSTRLTSLGRTASALAARRGVASSSLSRQLVGDLDWIVMKCLEKDRTRRYDTASSLAADVERHLRHEPVEAGPPSALYRFRKLARRRRGAVVAASLAMLGLGLGFTAAVLSYQRMHSEWEDSLRERETALAAREAAEDGRQLAVNQRQRSDRLNDFYSDVISGAQPAVLRERHTLPAGAPSSMGAPLPSAPAPDGDYGNLLGHAVTLVELEFADEPELAALAFATLGRGIVSRGLWEEGERVLPGAHARAELDLGSESPAVMDLAGSLTKVFVRMGRTADAVDNQRRLVEVHRRTHGLATPEALDAVGGLAAVFLQAGQNDEAEAALDEIFLSAEDGRSGWVFQTSDHSVEWSDEHDVSVLSRAPSGQKSGRLQISVSGSAVAAAPRVPRTPRPGGTLLIRDGGERTLLITPEGAPADLALEVEAAVLRDRLELATGTGPMASDLNAAAWMLLTTPSTQLRDARAALVLATDACDRTGRQDPVLLDTLSLALYRNGRKAEAEANQRQALELVPPTRTLLKAGMERALALFEGRIDEQAFEAGLRSGVPAR